MRILTLAILTVGMASMGPAGAPDVRSGLSGLPARVRPDQLLRMPLHVLPQCNATASGRSAQCIVNPYFAGGQAPAGYRRHRQAY